MPTTAEFPYGTTLNGLTWQQFLEELFATEYCGDCHGEQLDHEPWIVLGNWFAHCKQPIAAGVIVETQHGAPEHRGVVLDEPHPLEGWVWVQWDHIGRHDELVDDLTIAVDADGHTARKEQTT